MSCQVLTRHSKSEMKAGSFLSWVYDLVWKLIKINHVKNGLIFWENKEDIFGRIRENKEGDLQTEGSQAELWYCFCPVLSKNDNRGWGEGYERENLDNEKCVLITLALYQWGEGCLNINVNSGSWWWTGRPGVLQSMGSQRVGHDWTTELNWTD